MHPPTWNTPSFVLFYGAAQVQYWDGATWQSHQNFLSLNPGVPDTISFAPVTTTRLRITNFNVSGQHNPGWDEIEVFQLVQPRVDLYISSVISPPDTLWSSVSYPVRFLVKNNGIDPAQGFVMGYQIGNQSDVATYSNSLAPGDSLDFIFQNQLNTNLFSSSLLDCKFFVHSTADTNPSNDTLFTTRLMLTVGGASLPVDDHSLLWPNPFTDLLWVDIPGNGAQELKVFDIQGRLRCFLPALRTEESLGFNLAALPSGLYFIEVDGRVFKALKI
ncbi:MAG: T9SS type A sorting domain-containing protein [Bacteroidales bacterium]|nr:T9SS type A sorting domain-containing protein [Bacteroidales bacterium]